MGLLALAAVRRKHTVSKYFNNFYGITLKQEYIWIFFKLKIKITFPRTTGRQNNYKIQNFYRIFFFDGPVQKVKGNK